MTAPRWEDARDHALKILREERTSLVAELPRIESVDERELFDAWVARVDLALATIGRIDDAALARLAEPAQSSAVAYARVEPASMRQCGCVPPRLCPSCGLPRPESSAAERWRAVPAEQRGEVLAWLSGAREAFVEEHAEASVDDVRECRDRLRAIDALLALAREAEGGR